MYHVRERYCKTYRIDSSEIDYAIKAIIEGNAYHLGSALDSILSRISVIEQEIEDLENEKKHPQEAKEKDEDMKSQSRPTSRRYVRKPQKMYETTDYEEENSEKKHEKKPKNTRATEDDKKKRVFTKRHEEESDLKKKEKSRTTHKKQRIRLSSSTDKIHLEPLDFETINKVYEKALKEGDIYGLDGLSASSEEQKDAIGYLKDYLRIEWYAAKDNLFLCDATPNGVDVMANKFDEIKELMEQELVDEAEGKMTTEKRIMYANHQPKDLLRVYDKMYKKFMKTYEKLSDEDRIAVDEALKEKFPEGVLPKSDGIVEAVNKDMYKKVCEKPLLGTDKFDSIKISTYSKYMDADMVERLYSAKKSIIGEYYRTHYSRDNHKDEKLTELQIQFSRIMQRKLPEKMTKTEICKKIFGEEPLFAEITKEDIAEADKEKGLTSVETGRNNLLKRALDKIKEVFSKEK